MLAVRELILFESLISRCLANDFNLQKAFILFFLTRKCHLQQAVYFDVEDGRMIFAIPRDGITYVGTTDTVYNQDIDNPLATKEDVRYLISAINNLFPSLSFKS
jgi:glycerol-3-phosphate dehydrogenase